MMSTSASDDDAPPHVVTKHTTHPVRELLLGTVIGAHCLHDYLVLYYADGHKTAFSIDDEGDIAVADYEVGLPEC
jgi:hypothetical protein